MADTLVQYLRECSAIHCRPRLETAAERIESLEKTLQTIAEWAKDGRHEEDFRAIEHKALSVLGPDYKLISTMNNKKYTVTVERIQTSIIEVEAETEEHAREMAEKECHFTDYTTWSTIDYEITDIF